MFERNIQQDFSNEALMLSLAPLSQEFVAQEMQNPNSAIFKIYLSACMSVLLERIIEREALRFFQMLFLLNEAETAKRNAVNEYDRQQALNNDLYLLSDSQEYKDCVEILWSYPSIIEIIQEITQHLAQLVSIQNNQPALLQVYQQARTNFASNVVQGLRDVLGDNGTIALPNGTTVDIDFDGPAIQAMQGKMAARVPITQVLAPHVNPVLHQHVQTLHAEELAAFQKTKPKDYVPSTHDLQFIAMKVMKPRLELRKVFDAIMAIATVKSAIREKNKKGEPDLIESSRGAGIEQTVRNLVEEKLLASKKLKESEQESFNAEQHLIYANVIRVEATKKATAGFNRLDQTLQSTPEISHSERESMLGGMRNLFPDLAKLNPAVSVCLGHKR